MFELVISTVLVDGSEHVVTLSVVSILEFERLHTVSIIKAIDESLSMEYLCTLGYLALKQNGHVSNIDKFKSELKGVSYEIKSIPFGVTATTEPSQD